VEYFSKKILEVPTRSSAPGLTASQDSERFALYIPGLHLPADGTIDPADSGWPPHFVGWLATWFSMVTLACHNEGAAVLVGVQVNNPADRTPTARNKRFIARPELAERAWLIRTTRSRVPAGMVSGVAFVSPESWFTASVIAPCGHSARSATVITVGVFDVCRIVAE
jgi:hypothetical protein